MSPPVPVSFIALDQARAKRAGPQPPAIRGMPEKSLLSDGIVAQRFGQQCWLNVGLR